MPCLYAMRQISSTRFDVAAALRERLKALLHGQNDPFQQASVREIIQRAGIDNRRQIRFEFDSAGGLAETAVEDHTTPPREAGSQIFGITGVAKNRIAGKCVQQQV